VNYSNGRIPDQALTAIPGGGRLLAPVAVTWLAICAEVYRLYGWTPRPTGPLDAYRPYDGNYYAQVETFRRRYSPTRIAGRPTKVWNGTTYWLRPGQATAAVPGTSNHGWACAVDVTGLGGFTGTRYLQFAAVASRYGWTNSEGRRIGEPWHWVDVGTAHLVANGLSSLGSVPTAPDVTTPAPIEEDDMPYTPDELAAINKKASLEAALEAIASPQFAAAIDARVDLKIREQFAPSGEAHKRLVSAIPPAVWGYEVPYTNGTKAKAWQVVRDAREIPRRLEAAWRKIVGLPADPTKEN
jgi:hypothetical protein